MCCVGLKLERIFSRYVGFIDGCMIFFHRIIHERDCDVRLSVCSEAASDRDVEHGGCGLSSVAFCSYHLPMARGGRREKLSTMTSVRLYLNLQPLCHHDQVLLQDALHHPPLSCLLRGRTMAFLQYIRPSHNNWVNVSRPASYRRVNVSSLRSYASPSAPFNREHTVPNYSKPSRINGRKESRADQGRNSTLFMNIVQ